MFAAFFTRLRYFSNLSGQYTYSMVAEACWSVLLFLVGATDHMIKSFAQHNTRTVPNLRSVYKIAAGHRPIHTNDLAKQHMVIPCDRSIIWGVAQFIQAYEEELVNTWLKVSGV